MKVSIKKLLTILISLALLTVMAVLIINGRKKNDWIHAKQEQSIKNEDIRDEDFGMPWPSLLRYDFIPASHQSKIQRTNVLNTLVEKFNYQSYLEVGQGRKGLNFRWINCPTKIGVDPNKKFNAAFQMTSDEFFDQNTDSFDLIFIDGLHHADQVERDILNSLKVLNKNGTIVVHDCNPINETWQIVPRESETWTGDVWKAWVKLRATRQDLKMYVINVDFGCGIIRKGKQVTINIPEELTYKMLDENRKDFLNLVDINFFLQDIRDE